MENGSREISSHRVFQVFLFTRQYNVPVVYVTTMSLSCSLHTVRDLFVLVQYNLSREMTSAINGLFIVRDAVS